MVHHASLSPGGVFFGGGRWTLSYSRAQPLFSIQHNYQLPALDYLIVIVYSLLPDPIGGRTAVEPGSRKATRAHACARLSQARATTETVGVVFL